MFAIRFRCTAHNEFLIPPISDRYKSQVIQETLVTEKFGWCTINLQDFLCPKEHEDERKFNDDPSDDLYMTCRTTGMWAVETQTMMPGVDDPRDETPVVRESRWEQCKGLPDICTHHAGHVGALGLKKERD